MNNIKYIFLSLFLFMGFFAFAQETINMNASTNGRTYNTCNLTIYDSGGPTGAYSSSEDYRVTVCGLNGAHIEFTIVSLATESVSFDYLTAYEGPTSAGTQICRVGGTMNNAEYIATTNCVTFTWHSDSSVTGAGFQIEVYCGFPCQDYTVDIDPNAIYNAEDDRYYGCSNTVVTANVQFPNNNVNYEQTIENTFFSWNVLDETGANLYEGLGLSGFDEILAPGAYFFTVTTTDANRCRVSSNTITIYVSLHPTFEGTWVTDSICSGEVAELHGVVNPAPEWEMGIPEVNQEQHCFDDYHINEEQLSCFTYAAFAPGQIIQSPNDILSIGMNIEHSYMGDLDIMIRCPNGQTMTLFEQACGGTFFGEAVDEHTMGVNSCSDGPEWVGVGYTYYWTHDANQTMEDACGWTGNLPAGDYLPTGNWNDLVGCPVNGEWCVIFIDNLRLDDGTVFFTEFHFADHMIPAEENRVHFVNTYDENDMMWTGTAAAGDIGPLSTATPDLAGSIQPYVFSATDDFGCTYDTTLNVVVRAVDDPHCCIEPTPIVCPDILVCENTTNLYLETAVPAGNTGEWTVVTAPDGGTATFANPASPNTTVTVDTWGFYTFRWTELYFGEPTCNGHDDVTIEFRIQPTNDFSTTIISCFGNATEVMYEGNMTASANYEWDFGDGFVTMGDDIRGPHLVSWIEDGEHLISLAVSEHGCGTGVNEISVHNPEQLVIDSLTTVNDPCFHGGNGSARVYYHGGTLPMEFSWPAPGSEYFNVGAGNYSVTLTDANGCSVSRAYQITEPTQVIIQDVDVVDLSCYGSQDGTINVVAGGGTGNLAYAWSDAGVLGASRQGLRADLYTLVVTDENGCTASRDIQVSQPEELIITSLTNSNAICEGTNSDIAVTVVGGTMPYTYIWNNGTDFVGQQQISVLLHQTTTYGVQVRDSHGCESQTESMTVTVSPEMILQNVNLDQIDCHGSCNGRAELQIVGGLQPFQYSWGSDNQIYEGICEGTYSVTVTDMIGCSIATTFDINQPPAYNVSYTTDSVSCTGYDDGEARVFVEGATPPYTFLWPNGNTTDRITAMAGTYIVTITDAQRCRFTQLIEIKEPTPLVVLPMVNRTICKGQEATLSTNVTGGTPIYSYRWEGADGTSYNAREFAVSPDETTEYTLTIEDNNGCKFVSPRVTVNVNPDLQITSILSSTDTICPGEKALVYVEAIGGNGGPYVLTLDDGRVVPSPFAIQLDTTTMVHVTLSDMCGTPAVTDSILIHVHPYPQELFTAQNINGCVPLSVSFTPNLEMNVTDYLWQFGDNDFSEDPAPTHTYTKAGNYDVTVRVWDEFGCNVSKTIEDFVHAYPSPVASFEADLQAVSVLSAEVYFMNNSSGAYRYFWFFGDGDSTMVESPRHVYRNIGEYNVILVAESGNSCTDTVSRSVKVNTEFSFYAPTSFTPNGDGINDCFRICGFGISPNNFLLTIHDRWGALVYKTAKYYSETDCESCGDGGWDGSDWGNKNKGDAVVANGIYFWYCQFEDLNGVLHKEQGEVMLIK